MRNYKVLTILGPDLTRIHACLLEETPDLTSSFVSCSSHVQHKVRCFWCNRRDVSVSLPAYWHGL